MINYLNYHMCHTTAQKVNEWEITSKLYIGTTKISWDLALMIKVLWSRVPNSYEIVRCGLFVLISFRCNLNVHAVKSFQG